MIMKHVILLLSLFSINGIFSQSSQGEINQLAWYRVAEEKLLQNELQAALIGFDRARRIDPENELGKASEEKSDSLRTVVGNLKFNNILGTWILLESSSTFGSSVSSAYDPFQIIIQIDSTSLRTFESRSGERELINSKSIEFRKYGLFGWQVVFENQEVWSFQLNRKSDILKLEELGRIQDNGGYTIIGCGNRNLVYAREE